MRALTYLKLPTCKFLPDDLGRISGLKNLVIETQILIPQVASPGIKGLNPSGQLLT
jgi:hypothetical protein